jgi:regulator of sigma E protease
VIDALSTISFMSLGFYALAFIVVLSIIVFVHEYGHFIIGRWCGVRVETFSVGFGRELIGFKDRHGTRWQFCLWPLGGYVRFSGDANAASLPGDGPESHAPDSLHAQPVAKRAAIVAAGPIANFVLAILVFTAAYAWVGQPYLEPVVSQILPGSAAEKAGLNIGDRIIKIDGATIISFAEVQEAVWLRGGEELDVVVDRSSTELNLKLIPQISEQPDNFGGTIKVGLLGVRHTPGPDEPKYQTFSLPQAFVKGVNRTWYVVEVTFRFIGKLFTGEQSIKQIGGPASIAKGAGDAAANGLPAFVFFIGLLSVSIGLINLFPIPMLDGGHLVFFAIEAIRGKPLGPNAQEWGFRIGFALVAMLMLLGVFNDTGRIINIAPGT